MSNMRGCGNFKSRSIMNSKLDLTPTQNAFAVDKIFVCIDKNVFELNVARLF